MIGELNVYKQVYQLQLELDSLEQEAIKIAKVAINLEQYLKPIIGQFQGLIDRVVTIDGELSRRSNDRYQSGTTPHLIPVRGRKEAQQERFWKPREENPDRIRLSLIKLFLLP